MKKKKIIILDGQGGGVGRSISEKLLEKGINGDLVVVGTNAIATSNMMKSGIKSGATGEHAWNYNCEIADIIIGPIGIILQNSMNGEISNFMVESIMNSSAKKILLPVLNNHIHIVGIRDNKLSNNIEEVIKVLLETLE